MHPTDTLVPDEEIALAEIATVDDLEDILDAGDHPDAHALVGSDDALMVVGDPALRRAADRRMGIIKNLVGDDSVYQIAVSLLQSTGTDASRLRYAQDLRIYFGWARVEGLDPRKATRDDLVRYQDYAQRFKASSQMRLMTVLRLLYRELEAREMLAGDNPTKTLPRIRGKADEQPVGYSEEQAKDLLKGIEEQMAVTNEDYVRRYLAARDYAIIYLALTSGLRASELVALRCGDIHLDQGIYWVVQVQGKGRMDRSVSIPARTVEVVNTYKTTMEELGITLTDEDPLFIRIGPKADPQYAEAMTTRNLGKLVTKWTALADLSGKRKAVHQLRRTAATIAHDNDASIEQIGIMLGHADKRTTRDLYIDPADRVRKASGTLA